MAGRASGGLRAEIVASVSLLTLTAILLVGILLIQVLSQDSIAEQLQSARRMTHVLRSAIDHAMRSKEPVSSQSGLSGAEPLLSDLMNHWEIVLTIVDAEGKILGGEGPVDRGGVWMDKDIQTCLKEGREITRVSGRSGIWPLSSPKALFLTTPLQSSDGALIGALRVAVPLRAIGTGLFKSGWVLAIYLVLVIGILILFGSYMISRKILRPLKRLIGASECIARGDYDIAWDGFPPNEMARLAEAFCRMAQDLQLHQKTLEQKIEALDRSNKALVQAYQAMLRSEKLVSAGRLAAGVAHEVGNPIGSILGYAEILLQQTRDQTDRDCLGRIRSEAERIQRTIRALLDLARPAGRRWEWVDVDALVDETLAMTATHEGMKRGELQRQTEGDLLRIWADRDQVQQVFVNLMFNALDALEDTGQITVTTGMVPNLPLEKELVPPPRRGGDPSDLDFTPMRMKPQPTLSPDDGPFVFIRVEDTGGGIKPEDLKQVFEPFYSTKDPGSGTGLGLTVCLGIVESYGGRIHARSEPGEGSCFTVFFPIGKEVEDRRGDDDSEWRDARGLRSG